MTFKQKVHSHFLNVINERISLLQKALADLSESVANETKSTAGDKHETALAMLQIEQANTGTQLKDAKNKKAALERINPLIVASTIVNGSLIITDRGYLFLSTSLGKAIIDDISVTALSAQSPLGLKLLSLSVDQIAEINNTKYVIESIE